MVGKQHIARGVAVTMLHAVETTVAALTANDLDVAAVELARLYARQLDGAAAARRAADKALAAAWASDDLALVEQVSALRAKLGERACIDRIGARLHALLESLQATPKARAGVKALPSQTGTLHRLRAAK